VRLATNPRVPLGHLNTSEPTLLHGSRIPELRLPT